MTQKRTTCNETFCLIHFTQLIQFKEKDLWKKIHLNL